MGEATRTLLKELTPREERVIKVRFSIGECNEVTRMIVKSEGRLSEEQKKVIKCDIQEKKQALRDFQDDFGSTTADLKRTLDSECWRIDDELNPSGRVVNRLVLAYESQDVDVPPPNASEIEDVGRELLERRQTAEAALAVRPPSARPNTKSCCYCGVRQLCDEYWAGTTQTASDDGHFGDVELRIIGRHGPTS